MDSIENRAFRSLNLKYNKKLKTNFIMLSAIGQDAITQKTIKKTQKIISNIMFPLCLFVIFPPSTDFSNFFQLQNTGVTIQGYIKNLRTKRIKGLGNVKGKQIPLIHQIGFALLLMGYFSRICCGF